MVLDRQKSSGRTHNGVKNQNLTGVHGKNGRVTGNSGRNLENLPVSASGNSGQNKEQPPVSAKGNLGVTGQLNRTEQQQINVSTNGRSENIPLNLMDPGRHNGRASGNSGRILENSPNMLLEPAIGNKGASGSTYRRDQQNVNLNSNAATGSLNTAGTNCQVQLQNVPSTLMASGRHASFGKGMNTGNQTGAVQSPRGSGEVNETLRRAENNSRNQVHNQTQKDNHQGSGESATVPVGSPQTNSNEPTVSRTLGSNDTFSVEEVNDTNEEEEDDLSTEYEEVIEESDLKGKNGPKVGSHSCSNLKSVDGGDVQPSKELFGTQGEESQCCESEEDGSCDESEGNAAKKSGEDEKICEEQNLKNNNLNAASNKQGREKSKQTKNTMEANNGNQKSRKKKRDGKTNVVPEVNVEDSSGENEGTCDEQIKQMEEQNAASNPLRCETAKKTKNAVVVESGKQKARKQKRVLFSTLEGGPELLFGLVVFGFGWAPWDLLVLIYCGCDTFVIFDPFVVLVCRTLLVGVVVLNHPFRPVWCQRLLTPRCTYGRRGTLAHPAGDVVKACQSGAQVPAV
nr:hypothetical protein Iba_chr13fCG10330 [Ipomoea batatas]